MGEALRRVVTASEEISIPCRTIALFRPQLEEQRAFQNEIVAVTGAAQPEENASPYMFRVYSKTGKIHLSGFTACLFKPYTSSFWRRQVFKPQPFSNGFGPAITGQRDPV